MRKVNKAGQKSNKVSRRAHTPGQTRARDQYRADVRSLVAGFLERAEIASVQEITRSLGISPQRAVGALNQLFAQGVVLKVRPGIYSDTSDVQPEY